MAKQKGSIVILVAILITGIMSGIWWERTHKQKPAPVEEPTQPENVAGKDK
jgi:hypothetical protein